MENSKLWWKSKTVLASLVTVVVGILTAINIDHVGNVQVENVQANASGIVDQLLGLGAMATGVIALYGRLTAKSKLTGPGEAQDG